MAETPADRYRRVAARFTARVKEVSEEGWENPAPPDGWVARDVIGHLVEWIPAFISSAGGPALPEGPSVDTDPVGAWTTLSDGVQALLDDPETAGMTIDHPRAGTHRLDEAVNTFFTNDVFMHTWDLARAAGLDETLDPDIVHELFVEMEPLDEVLRSSGQYGPRVEVPDDADEQTKLIAFIGRQP